MEGAEEGALTMTSPGFIPARSAGLPGITCTTRVPASTAGKRGSRFRSCADTDDVTAESSTGMVQAQAQG